ncbi:MAG: methionine--tRNA ligase [Clostridia bacterium]|nr:methionine--tRNA ligase [Clostridia bacterium]
MKLNVLIGLSWPYANGNLHLGHIASSLPADVIARYYRDHGAAVSFVSGSDCFGTPILVTAKAENLTPNQIAEKYATSHKRDLADLGFTFDNFTATLTPAHQQFAANFHADLYDTDNVFVKTVPQLYCNHCQQYLPDRYVEGTCPFCGEHAKGDSCDHCGKILEPEDLKDPRCKLCGATPELRETKQIYLRLSKFQKAIEKNLHDKQNQWTNNAVGMTNKYLNEGLVDRAITRNITWGVPLPDNAKKLLGDITDKRVYIWAENVLGYLSATQAVKPDWQDFLLDDNNTPKRHYYVHAKDNIPFHSVILPGLLLAENKHRWHLPDYIISSEYLNMNGKKISKSTGNYISARQLIDNFNVDMIRYYFLRNTNDKKDANFSFEDFVYTVNGELIDNFGNLVNRTLSFIKNKFNGEIPAMRPNPTITQTIESTRTEFNSLIEAGACSKALATAMTLVAFGNKWFSDNTPWKTLDPQTIAECVTVIRAAVEMLKYFIPNGTAKVETWLANKTLGDISVLYQKLDINEVKGRKW